MFIKLSLAILLLAFGQYASAQVIRQGKCPSLNLPETFNWPEYLGTWYEWAKYPAQYESNLKCSTATYGDAGNNTVSVHNVGINKVTGEEDIIDGYAKILAPAQLAVVFFPGQSETVSNYNVLDTDYKNYAVVFSCSQVAAVRADFLWILTRSADPSEDVLAKAFKVITENKISKKPLVRTVQDC